jgi:hypothetical protein
MVRKRNGEVLLVVEVKGGQFPDEYVAREMRSLMTEPFEAPLGLWAEPERLRFYEPRSGEPILQLPAEDVVERYMGRRPAAVGALILETTLEEWLSELTSEEPEKAPHAEALAGAGVIERLKGGIVEVQSVGKPA